MINVLSYWHHSDLWWSLQLLCNRLGFTLSRMVGMEWYEKGFFDIYDPQIYAHKYLVDDVGLYQRLDPDFPSEKTLNFKSALETPIDIILCSNRETERPLWDFARKHKPNAKLIRQVGNMLDTVDIQKYPHTLYSDKQSFEENQGHKILYHQEFRMDLFTYQLSVNKNRIYTFQNDYHQYKPAEVFSNQLKQKFPDYILKEYGRNTTGGFIFPKRDYIRAIREASFIWQVKHWEGYSHNIHSSFALGRPMILRREDIKGKIFEPLCDETTTIFTDQLERIRTIDLQDMSANCRIRFENTVNFDKEAEELKKFFELVL